MPPTEIDRSVADFELLDVSGERRSLASFEGRSFFAVVFIGNGCPTVRLSEERLRSIQQRYAPRGVQVVAINSNDHFYSPPDTFEAMRERARESSFNFPYLKDEDGAVAAAFGAERTPEVFVVDRSLVLRYRGRIDDTRDPSRRTASDLENALDDLTSGRPVRVPVTEPFGCAIVR